MPVASQPRIPGDLLADGALTETQPLGDLALGCFLFDELGDDLAESVFAQNRNAHGEGDMEGLPTERIVRQESPIPKIGDNIKDWVYETVTNIREHHDTHDFFFVSAVNSLTGAQQKEVAAAISNLPDEDKLPILKNILQYEVDDSAMGARLIAAEGLKSLIENDSITLGQENGMVNSTEAIKYINKWAKRDNTATTQWINTQPRER